MTVVVNEKGKYECSYCGKEFWYEDDAWDCEDSHPDDDDGDEDE